MRGALAMVGALVVCGCGQPSPDGATTPPASSRMVEELRGAGMSLSAMPASLADLPAAQLDVVMKTFSTALGVDCNGCHDPANVAAATDRVNIAKRMWSDFVVQMRFADGRALYCDSCHQGRATFLSRSDTHALGLWMERYFRDGLVRSDHRPNDCFHCHGSPFNPGFLDSWAGGN